jgi:hypothetical protein
MELKKENLTDPILEKKKPMLEPKDFISHPWKTLVLAEILRSVRD